MWSRNTNSSNHPEECWTLVNEEKECSFKPLQFTNTSFFKVDLVHYKKIFLLPCSDWHKIKGKIGSVKALEYIIYTWVLVFLNVKKKLWPFPYVAQQTKTFGTPCTLVDQKSKNQVIIKNCEHLTRFSWKWNNFRSVLRFTRLKMPKSLFQA